MIFRRASLSDLEELVRLRMLFVSEANSGKSLSPSLADAARQYLSQHLPNSDSLICWVASNGSALVATASLIRFQRFPSLTNPTGAEGYISNVYTEPACRRNGIASTLMQSLVTESRRCGIYRLWLYAREDGYGVYKKIGFTSKQRAEIEMQLQVMEPPS